MKRQFYVNLKSFTYVKYPEGFGDREDEIALGCFMQESYSFSPVTGSWMNFGSGEIHRGDEVSRAFMNTRTNSGGVLHSAAAAMVITSPVLLLTFAVKKCIVKDLTFGAVKG